MPGVHDLAGKPAGAVHREPHAESDFDRRVDALVNLLLHPNTNVLVVDELRRAVEDVGERDYFALSYYQRWVHALRALLVEKGVLRDDEIDQRLATIRKQLALSGHDQ
ncbi:MAG: nitrile hydratase subunit beta [Candidatus Lambdaproteobacteria bacterium]|nr:nitrile hydratase subunit beta [Candidatus Lambdaproteobacteria bacterium]